MGLRILHVADTHLGRGFAQLGPRADQRRNDLLDTFARICDLASERQVAAVLVAGDLFDSYHPAPDLIGAVQNRIDQLVGANIRVFIIPGNHDDRWYPKSVWREHSFNAHVFDEASFTSASFESDGVPVHIHGLAYNHTVNADPLSTLQPDGEGIHIAMLHATVDPPAGFAVEQRYLPLSADAVLGLPVNYVALGHIHRQRTFGRQTLACYPGTPEALDMTETGPRTVAVVDFEGDQPRVELVPVNRRTVEQVSVDVTGLTDEEIVERVRNLGSPDRLLRLELRGAPDAPVDPAWLRTRAAESFFWLELADDTETVSSQWVENIVRENTIRGRFVVAMRQQIRACDDPVERARLELALRIGLAGLQRRSVA